MRFLKTLLLVAISFLTFGGGAFAQDAIVIMRPERAVDACTPATDLRFTIIGNYKINGQDELRLAGNAQSISGGVSRDAFNKMRKVKLKEISEMEMRDGVLLVTVGGEQKMAAVPDVEPAKNSSMALSQYAAMTLEGETRDRAKQKQLYPLNSITRMFPLVGAVTSDEALFRHSQEEATVGAWTAYLAKIPSYKVKEAGDGLTGATGGCLDAAMNRFASGQYAALEEAKVLGQRLAGITGNTPESTARLADIAKSEQDFLDQKNTGMQQRRDEKWDDALATWEPLTKYLRDPALRDFAAVHTETITKSHDFHIAMAGRATEKRGLSLELTADAEVPYREALKEYETALKRRPDSASARDGRRQMLIQLGLLNARRSRTAKDLENAHETLLKLISDYGGDSKVSEELKAVNKEYGQQLFEKARTLVTTVATIPAPTPARGAAPAPARGATPPAAPARGAATVPPQRGATTGARDAAPPANAAPPPSAPAPAAPTVTYKIRSIATAVDKKPFLDARSMLTLAMNLDANDDKSQLLNDVNVALADYLVAMSKRALSRKLYETALLSAQAAQSYQPGRPEVDDLVSQSLAPVQQKAQIQAGVVLTSVSTECADIARQIGSSLETVLISAGSNVQLLASDQANQILRQMRTGNQAPAANYAILSGQIGVCTINNTSQRRQVLSKIQTVNPRYEPTHQLADNYDRQYDACKKQAKAAAVPESTACAQAKNLRDQANSAANREQPFNLTDYSYEEQPITTTGQLRLTLQIDDSILRGTRAVGDAAGSVNDSCTERRGIRDDDWSHSTNVTYFGFNNRPAQPVQNGTCPPLNRSAKLFEMSEQARQQGEAQVLQAFRNVAKSYFEVAKRSTDPDLALENYITFALLAFDKSSTDYRETIDAIRSRDADLKPETALR